MIMSPIVSPQSLFSFQNERHNKVITRIGWFLLRSLCLVFIIFYVYASISNSFDLIPERQLVPENRLHVTANKGKSACDLFSGKWAPDARGPIYSNWSCGTMADSKNCGKYGRDDEDFLFWRWKPNDCELPRFDPREFLELVRGKMLAFIGDSVARNQMESLLCLLSQVEVPSDVYKDKDNRFRTWHFLSYDFTLMVRWTQFLVAANERVINGTYTGVFDVQLDQVDLNWATNLTDLDYAVISDGHWFFHKLYLYQKTQLMGCVFCDERNITNLGQAYAVKWAFQTALDFIGQCQDCKQPAIFVRTISPAHFEHGGWNTGGKCNRTHPASLEEVRHLGVSEWEMSRVQVEVAEKGRKKTDRKRVGVLDVTQAMRMRPDGHPDSHWNNQWMGGYHDCVHWCLPGPIDTWNEFLLELLKRDQQPSYTLL